MSFSVITFITFSSTRATRDGGGSGTHAVCPGRAEQDGDLPTTAARTAQPLSDAREREIPAARAYECFKVELGTVIAQPRTIVRRTAGNAMSPTHMTKSAGPAETSSDMRRLI